MYDMYPEWGPAKHRRDDDGATARSLQASLDRDTAERPDDN